MFNSGPRARPELRRSQSVQQISSYALTLHRETSDSENSVSDLSLDTCFHPNSGHGNSDSENEDHDEEKEEEEEEENENKKRSNDSDKKEDETSDFLDDSDPELAQDSTHVHPYRRRRRGRHHGDNEDDAALKSMIVTSFRSPKIASKRKVVMRRPSQANDFDAATSFRLDSTILDRRRRLLMTRVESLHSPETNDPPRKVRGTLERGSSSMRNLSTKSREFEDLLGTVTDRDVILQDMDPFLSGDDDPTNHNIKSLRRKSSKRSTTTSTTTTLTSKERNQVNNNNNKQIVLAYDGQEGNLFPEISKEEKAKFQGCGNAWLEGKFSTTADWKRDATGMMLELNIPSKSDDRKNRRKSKDDIHRSSSHEIPTNYEKENEDDISLPGECYDIPLQHVISDKDESESVTSRSRQRTSTGDFSATRDNKSLKHRSSSSSHKKQQQHQSKDRNHRTKSNRTTDRRMEGKGGVVDEQSDDGSISLAAETMEEDDIRKTSKSRTHQTSRKFKQPQRRISFESINTVPSITESWNAEEEDDDNEKEELKNKKKEKKQSDSHKFRSEEQGDYPKSASPKHGIPRMRSMEETSSSYPVASNQGSDDIPTSRNSRSSPRRSSYHHPEQEQPKSSDSKVSSSRRRSDSDGNKKMRSKSVDDTDDSIHDSKSKEPMRKNRTKVLEKKQSTSVDSTNETNKEKEKVSSSRHTKKSPMRSNSKSTSQKMDKRNEKDEDDLVKKSKSSKTSPNRTSKEKVVDSDMREKLRLSNKADHSPRKERRLKEQSSPRRDQLSKHTESDLDTSTGAETSRRRRSDTSKQLSDTSGKKASSRSKDDDDIELSNSNFSKVSLTSPSENNNPKDETLLKTDKKQRRRRRSTSVPRNAVDKAVAKLEKELLGTEYDESRKASNRDDDKGISKPSPITLEGCPSVSSDVQDVELTQRLRNTTSVSNTTDIPNSTLNARNAFSQPRRSSSLPRGAEAALQKSIETPNHDNTTTTLRSRNSIRRGSHHQRRRSSSQPRNAEDAFRKSNENQESQQKQQEHHSRSRTKEDQTMDRYRRTSVPRDEMMRDAAAAAAAVLADERNRQRRESHSKSSHKRRSSSLPRGVENKHQRDRNVSSSDKVDMDSFATAGPPARRRLSIGGSTYDEPPEDNDAPRPRRRRSLTVGGEVITSGTGEDHPPPTPIRKQNESHQYVQFEEVATTTRISLPTASLVSMGMNPNKQTSKGSANSNNGSGKPSFLARFASRFEAETIKPLEKRASMIKQQQQQVPSNKQQQQEIVPRAKAQDNRMMDRSNVGGGSGAVSSERVVSHQQQMPSTNTTTSKYTPTVTEVPIGNKGTSTYSDLVMQGKIGMMVSNHDTELQE